MIIMKVKGRFAHYNFNVRDLDASVAFYEKALGLSIKREHRAADGRFAMKYLTDGQSDFLLELTWLRDWDRPYNLGDNEMHLCFQVPAEQYKEIREYHRAMDAICYENHDMDLYFIADPDGYWLEIVPDRR
jgi:lactoylglutathione lyase